MCRDLLCVLPVVLVLGLIGNALEQKAMSAAAAEKNLAGWWKLDDASGPNACRWPTQQSKWSNAAQRGKRCIIPIKPDARCSRQFVWS